MNNDVPIWIYLILGWAGIVIFGQVIVPAIEAHLAISIAIGVGGPLAALGFWFGCAWLDQWCMDRELRAAQKAETARWEAIHADKRAKGRMQLDTAFAKNEAETARRVEAARAETTPEDDEVGPLDEAA